MLINISYKTTKFRYYIINIVRKIKSKTIPYYKYNIQNLY